MKANTKQRQQLQRDVRAFTLMLWYVLNTLHWDPWNWGPVRLQRLYDAAMERMYDNSSDEWAGWIIEDWAIKMGLTEKDRLARKEAAKK